jgi:hypothetical protein
MRTLNTKPMAYGGCFIALFAAGWLGCSADPIPSKGTEKVESASQGISTSSGSGGTLSGSSSGSGNYPLPPACANGPENVVYAHFHTSTSVPGYLTGYTDSFPLPSTVDPYPAVQAYEQEIWDHVYRSNGYAYLVTWDPQSPSFVAVGINSSTTTPPYSMTPPAGNVWPGSPTTADWDEEYGLAGTHTGGPVSAHYPPLTCVQVLAFGDGNPLEGARQRGTLLEFFPVVELHDPNGPDW